MKKKIYFLFVLLAALVFAVGAGCVGEKQEVTEQKTDEVPATEIQEKTVLLTINYGDGKTETFEEEVAAGMKVFDLLKNVAEKNNIEIQTTQYDFGISIDAIGDKKGGEDGKYWLYYVNGQMAQVGADQQEIKAGDKVEFKFE